MLCRIDPSHQSVSEALVGMDALIFLVPFQTAVVQVIKTGVKIKSNETKGITLSDTNISSRLLSLGRPMVAIKAGCDELEA